MPLDSRLVLPVNSIVDNNYRIRRVVAAGGFGITYEAEDTSLGTTVAIKEYYPVDFGDRISTLGVRPKSERHKPTFEKGRWSFLQEARTLARFEHASIVRVTRVFEANATAYMVMRFEQGQSFEAWLRELGRPPSQAELDSVLTPLLDALELLHAASFLHRDIAPDNIIIRPDGTPVLLDFGAARRAVAELSRSLTGIVKPGYSPHEQYAADGRLQGPWSDLYALGGTLYRAVTGRPPDEATLRVDEDAMVPASRAAKDGYRPEFLGAIDACLKVKQSERPQSVADLRRMLLGAPQQARATVRLPAPGAILATGPRGPAQRHAAWRWPAVAAVLVMLGGAYGGYHYQRAGETPGANLYDQRERTAREAESRRQAALDAERQQREMEAADAQRHQLEEARRRKELADAAEAEARRRADAAAEERRKAELRIAELEARRREEARQEQIAAEAKRQEEARLAALEEARRRDEAARRQAELETRRKEEMRIAALEEKRKEDERLRLATIPDDAARTAFVRRVQQALSRTGCYSGPDNGNTGDAQKGLDMLVDTANKRGKTVPPRIELAKASTGDFESWLSGAAAIKGELCLPPAKSPVPTAIKAKPERATPERHAPAPASAATAKPSGGGNCFNRCVSRRGHPAACSRRCS
jgi:hypothetical protein